MTLDLKTHNSEVHNIKLFTCVPPCDFNTNRKVDLDRHQGQKSCRKDCQYQCEYCMKYFTKKETKDNHLSRRKCEKQFSCQICEQYFTSTSLKLAHVCTI